MKAALVIAALIATGGLAAAQTGARNGGAGAARAAPHGKIAHAAARAERPPPVVIPQQFAPPQEVYASLPAAEAAAAPAQPSACEVGLAKIASFKPIPVLIGAGDCGADDAVQMDSVILPDQSKVAVTPPAILRCPMAEQVAQWLRDDVAPSLKNLPPLRGLDNFDSYSCRGRNNVRAAQLSEHGRADAIDVRDFRLADGRELRLTDINMAKDWRDDIRDTACARFSTVLGPGSDGYHEEHIHLDLEPRRNNYKICEWDVRVPPPPVVAEKTPGSSGDAAAAAADQAAAADSKGGEQDVVASDMPLIPAAEVPLPRPRPMARMERAPSHRGTVHRSSLDRPLNLTAQ